MNVRWWNLKGESKLYTVIVLRPLPHDDSIAKTLGPRSQSNFSWSELQVQLLTKNKMAPAAMFPSATLLLFPRRVVVATDQDNTINFVQQL